MTMVTACPRARSALGSAAETSARPPILTKGASSVVTNVISIGGPPIPWQAGPMTRVRGSSELHEPPAGVAEDSVVTVLRVPPEVAGQRVDVFVQAHLHRTSRTRAQAIVRASAYDGAGRKLDPNDRVRPEQYVLLWRAPRDETPV